MSAPLGRRRAVGVAAAFTPRDAERVRDYRRRLAAGERPLVALVATLATGDLGLDRWRRRAEALGHVSVARAALESLLARGTAQVAADDSDVFDADALVEQLVADMRALETVGSVVS